jgi:hypothetical protein
MGFISDLSTGVNGAFYNAKGRLSAAVDTSALNGIFNPSFIGATRLTPFSVQKYTSPAKQTATTVNYPDSSRDWRVRISLPPASSQYYFTNRDSILNPLRTALSTSDDSTVPYAVVFPYTPQISVTHTATYSQQKLTHNNYAQYFYENSEINPISITGEFTVQNILEGQYLLAAIYFFRSITKMFYGNDGLAGNPPPMVFLNGYGQYYLPNVPCVVTSFQHTMPEAVDYIDVPTQQAIRTGAPDRLLNSTRLPSSSQLSVTLQPVYSRLSQNGFTLSDFAAGKLLNKKESALPVSAFGSTNKTQQGGVQQIGGFL